MLFKDYSTKTHVTWYPIQKRNGRLPRRTLLLLQIQQAQEPERHNHINELNKEIPDTFVELNKSNDSYKNQLSRLNESKRLDSDIKIYEPREIVSKLSKRSSK